MRINSGYVMVIWCGLPTRIVKSYADTDFYYLAQFEYIKIV